MAAFAKGNEVSKKHGHTWLRENGTVGRSPTYQSWRCMISRCRHEGHPWFHAYGNRGIAVCDEWQGKGGFERFLKDMGKRPSLDMTLDRIDVNKGYFRENCRWADKATQRANIRVLPKPERIKRKKPKSKKRVRKRNEQQMPKVRAPGTGNSEIPPF